MLKFCTCLILFLGSLMVKPAMSWAGDPDCAKTPDDPRCVVVVDDDDSVDTGDETAKKTFSMPPMKAGFMFDFYHTDLLPHLAMEAFLFNVPKLGDFTIDIGVATSRAFVTLTWEVIPIVKIGPAVWVGYNVREEDPAFGVGISLLDF